MAYTEGGEKKRKPAGNKESEEEQIKIYNSQTLWKVCAFERERESVCETANKMRLMDLVRVNQKNNATLLSTLL